MFCISHLPLILSPTENYLLSSDRESPLVKIYSGLNVYVNIETGWIVLLEDYDERTKIFSNSWLSGNQYDATMGGILLALSKLFVATLRNA
jgi:hypothetical protein